MDDPIAALSALNDDERLKAAALEDAPDAEIQPDPEAPVEAAADEAEPAPAEVVVLTGDFETDTGGYRKFSPGEHALPAPLAAEARAKGLVALDPAE